MTGYGFSIPARLAGDAIVEREILEACKLLARTDAATVAAQMRRK